MIAVVAIYAAFRIGSMNIVDLEQEAEIVYQRIEKALIQSYALEGSYPSEGEFEEKMGKYGVYLDVDKFIFSYHVFASNILPEFFVVPRI